MLHAVVIFECILSFGHSIKWNLYLACYLIWTDCFVNMKKWLTILTIDPSVFLLQKPMVALPFKNKTMCKHNPSTKCFSGLFFPFLNFQWHNYLAMTGHIHLIIFTSKCGEFLCMLLQIPSMWVEQLTHYFLRFIISSFAYLL